MAGIYIHIPYCKQACHYCDFYFTTNLKNSELLIDALLKEIEIGHSFLKEETIETIYFGGGTPSLIGTDNIQALLEAINNQYRIGNVEVTLECNPDDLDRKKLKELKDVGINRLSIGIQSFNDRDLKLFNRAHDSKMAHQCLEDAREVGFENITMDLIYGIPDQSIEDWQKNLELFHQYNLPHLSAYSLTFEEKTAFGNWLKKGKIQSPPDEKVNEQFKLLMASMSSHGFEHYEISNFCKPGFISRHNSAYWKGEKYLGIGPSAHSYDGKVRRWNVANNHTYIKRLEEGKSTFEEEMLSQKDKINEYLLTTLRTHWGSDLKFISSEFGEKVLSDIQSSASHYVNSGDIVQKEDHWFLSEKGKFVADQITSDLFVI